MPLQRARWNSLDAAGRQSLLRRPAVEGDAAIREAVLRIVAEVRDRGDDALRELTAQLDRAELGDLRVSREEMDAAVGMLPSPAVDAIDLAIRNVRSFHEAQRAPDVRVETMPGVRCERVSRPIDAVGLYVPAGTAPLPSAAIMLAVPAVIAGCATRIVCTPPRPDGRADPAVVVASVRAGVTDIFKIGGAQAVAAMAYGTESVPKVSKVFGPGNAWVTCAKSVVSSDPDGAAIDMPAGPSEVLVIADDSASPEFVASDLLSQAEHGVDSQVVLVTTSDCMADAVEAAIQEQLESLSRAAIARGSLQHARLVIVEDLRAAVEVSNGYAPEHLILQCRDARALVPAISNAGSVFVGEWTPESVGDYCSGTNHVLPTYGYARSYSGLGLDEFMRGMTVQELTRDGLQGLSEAVVTLAGLEGLDAHATAVTRRLRGRS
jgi:histidinol dehydrogenase